MESENQATTKSLQILIVEDNDTDYLLLERQLKKLMPAAAFTRAANRLELIETLRHRWDVIISDYHLPDIEGEDLLLLIAQSHFHTPCLLLSGSIEGVTELDTQAHVYARVQKGDTESLRTALLDIMQLL